MAKKTPKWLERWNELTAGFEYLEIKGWYKWQQKNYTTDYIRDYYGKDEDPDYYMLPKLECWMMDWLRRQRGRMRHTLPNDPIALLKRMNLNRYDAAIAPTYLLHMVECTPSTRSDTVEHPLSDRQPPVEHRFLIPTNEQVRDQKPEHGSPKVNETKENENKTKRSSTSEVRTSLDNIPSETEVRTPTLKCGSCKATIVKGWKKPTCPACKRPLGKSQSLCPPHNYVPVARGQRCTECGDLQERVSSQDFAAAMEPGDDVEMSKSKAFQIED